MNEVISQLAKDLDDFDYDYDYYGYNDAIDDREQNLEDLKHYLANGLYVDGIIDHLVEIINEHDPDWEPQAQALLDRVKALFENQQGTTSF